MQREQRLRRSRDFAAVRRRGRSYAGGLLMLRSLPNGLSVSRAGFVTGKRLGNAVTRNRVKRRLRAAFDAIGAAPGFDLVISARSEAATTDYATLHQTLSGLMHRAKLAAPATPAAQRRQEPDRTTSVAENT